MRHEIEFGLEEMLYTYFLWEHDREKGRYNFDVRRDQLVNHLKTNDRGWKQSYFLDRLVRGIFLPFRRLLVSQHYLVLVHFT